MIIAPGPEATRTVGIPELEATPDRADHPFYHFCQQSRSESAGSDTGYQTQNRPQKVTGDQRHEQAVDREAGGRGDADECCENRAEQEESDQILPPGDSGGNKCIPDAVRLRAIQYPMEQPHIAIHPDPFAMLFMAFGLQEIGSYHRRYHPRDSEAHQHRHDNSDPEILEKLAGNAWHQPYRQENSDDAEGGRDNREADFICGVNGGLIGGFTHAHMAHDILDLDNGIIDKDTRHQTQGKQGEKVEIESEQIHEPEGRDGRKRDGDS